MKAPTQKEVLLKYIHDFGSVSSMQAFSDLGITRLAARISDLEEEGYLFKRETIASKNRYGKTVHFMKYSLMEETK